MAGVVDPYIIVDQCLEWIRFGIPNQQASISTEAGFNSLDDLNDIEEKDIRDMADSFQKRTIANRINFGMRRTKWLIAMMHCDTIPTKNGRELVEKWVSELRTNF